ncbi:MAG TPA: kelch repeat-containing protein [Gemmatimonadaceae bacterium]|nr:kelch repeat-containing protein [Gemmatimonadaceae bacterium]
MDALVVGAAASLVAVAMVACDGSRAVSPSGTKTDSTPSSYRIRLSPASIELIAPPGTPTSITVTASVLKGNDTTAVPDAQVTWAIDAPSVATVTTAGTVTAVAPGTTTLHARYSGVEVSAAVTVAAAPIVPGVAFVPTGSMTRARVGHTATLLANGKVLIAGGGAATAELYDPATGTFALTGSMSVSRSLHSATLLPDGRVLVAGGYSGDPFSGSGAAKLETAEVYDPATGSFTRTADMLEAQSGQTGTLLANGKILLTGGFGSCCDSLPKPELYDPATGTFAATGAYVPYSGLPDYAQTVGLANSTATLLRDGRVLVAAEPAAQLYDPATGTFTLTGQMRSGGSVIPPYITGRTATLLENGRVFFAGGENEDIGRFESTELFDATSGTFAFGPGMAVVRDGHTATLLSDGKVLVVGGESTIGCDSPSTCEIVSTASAELYDPGSGTLASAGSMSERRELHRATLLNDGRVLVTGGLTFIGGPIHFGGGVSVTPLATAELYAPR